MKNSEYASKVADQAMDKAASLNSGSINYVWACLVVAVVYAILDVADAIRKQK